ncbi:MAG TPA: nitronate monooxygenase family protein [Saprospiraceae bacterium]|nr:nitronate monooxygenase [Saprospiraceae bacterium]MCB9328924.1 nitronate monooxygenase [Lewinellaceae bacterium]HPK08758.1 nitronate monooxygenase family protein [Saprospiraceae bacterium]HPQ20220.1 nitronate monooxygenase family protein [Saprospiraceae bacterium]HRX28146.1 nitronate monooxygenase family protein [Saprospiraceae bacterium]
MNTKAALQSLRMPIIAAPMFLISGPKMVIECCKNGIVGTFPSLNQKSTDGFEEWVVEIKTELELWERETGNKAAPFGVNLIVHPTNMRVRDDLMVCIKHEVPLIITSLGAVSDLVDAVHAYGGLVFHDVIKKRHAEKALEAGVDGLILVTAGAGGHAGNLNPMAFVEEIRQIHNGYLVLSGCISTGRDIATALQMGVDFAYMGTRFINTLESKAPDDYKSMIINSSADDIIYTAAVSGVNANFLKPSLEAMGITESQWESKAKVDFGKELKADSEAKAWKTIWSAGQGVSNIHDTLPVSKLVDKLEQEFLSSLEAQVEILKKYKK